MAEDAAGVSFTRLDVVDPVSGRRMDAAVFYPSTSATDTTSVGPYDIDASRNMEIGAGRYPLVLISHGNLGSLWGHHGLASFLSREGHIVVTVMHPGDNFQDASGNGAVTTVYGRPLQISAALTSALHEPSLASHIDDSRIGFVGFSAGGTTGLILAGAKPDFRRLEAYCASRPQDQNVCEADGQIRNDRPDLAPTADPRIGSFVLMAPLSVMFAPQRLEDVRNPVMIYVAGNDQELSSELNGVALAQALPSASELRTIPDADHFVFLAPCSERFAQSAPELCTDAARIDRRAVHANMNQEIVGFLATSLDSR